MVFPAARHPSLVARPVPTGCRLGLRIEFGSLHTGVFGIIPSGEPVAFRSNGNLETEYLNAIQREVKNGGDDVLVLAEEWF